MIAELLILVGLPSTPNVTARPQIQIVGEARRLLENRIFYLEDQFTASDVRHMGPNGSRDTLLFSLPKNYGPSSPHPLGKHYVFAYSTSEDGSTGYDLYANRTVNIAGAIRLTNEGFEFINSVQHSRDGSKIVFTAAPFDVAFGLYRMTSTGGSLTRLDNGEDSDLARDGTDRIVYTRLFGSFGEIYKRDLNAAPGVGTRLTNVTLKGTGAPNAFGPRSIGIVIRSGRDYGRVEIENTAVLGYVEGVAIEGASVAITNSRIGRSDKGVVLYNGELNLSNSRIRASTVGVAAASGHAVVTDNVFAGVREVIYAENRATVEASGNRVWSQYLCSAQFRDRYRGRYEPYWRGGDGWECMYGSYPQNWWENEDGLLGLPYQDDGYQLEGYREYQSGIGYYTRDGRYVRDERNRGDNRWRGGGGLFSR